MMILGMHALPLGGHLAGWRHAEAFDRSCMNLPNTIEVAKLAERGLFDMLFLADGNGVRQMDKPKLFEANSPSDRPAVFEPVTLFAALSQHTKHLGFVATATTSYDPPYLIARKFASLDHLSGGRAGWNLVTTQYVEDSRNFGRDEHFGRETRYEMARECLDVVRGLWDSWGGDAFVQEKATGRYLDASKVRRLDHKGPYFQVQGPLNVARCPQGQPIVCMAGQSEAGRELAAYGADALFGTAANLAEGKKAYDDIKARMAKYGRAPDQLKILPGMSVMVGRTADEANRLLDELQSLIAPDLALSYLSKIVNLDLAGYDPDGPMPQTQAVSLGGTAIGRSVLAMAEREALTVRQTYERVLPNMSGNMAKGGPKEIADVFEAWWAEKACDGFVLSLPVLPRSLRLFVELVVPELQRRGLFRSGYEGRNLRENLGLAVPGDPFGWGDQGFAPNPTRGQSSSGHLYLAQSRRSD